MEADSWEKPSGSALVGHVYALFGHFYAVKYALLTLKVILKRGDLNLASYVKRLKKKMWKFMLFCVRAFVHALRQLAEF